MKTKHNIQLTLEDKEKQHILKIYDDNSINVSKRVLNLIREDVKRLEEKR